MRAELSCTLLGCVSKLATTGLLQRSAALGILAQRCLLVSCHARQKQEKKKKKTKKKKKAGKKQLEEEEVEQEEK